MGHSEQFRKQAEECRQMAELNLGGDKEIWERMAARWAHFAALEEGRAPTHDSAPRRRTSRFGA